MATGLGGDAGVETEPHPDRAPIDCLDWWAAAAGLESKKLPPLKPEKAEALLFVCADGREDVKLPRPEKASTCAGLGEGELAKLRPLNASFKPPPKEFWV